MNREIKFRFWDKYLKAMIYANFKDLCGGAYVIEDEIVMQYTGLKNKNGKEIFEGDILEEDDGYYFEVIWDNKYAKFKLQWRTKAYQFPEWNRGIKMNVVGNIYENPELLKESEDNE